MAGHGSWRLGLGARRRILEEVKAGMSQKRGAARFCVSRATVNRWVRREREASTDERVRGVTPNSFSLFMSTPICMVSRPAPSVSRSWRLPVKQSRGASPLLPSRPPAPAWPRREACRPL